MRLRDPMGEWTTGQEDLLHECGHLGAEAVQRELLLRYGVCRTVRAIEAKASRIGVSLRVQTVCPECGVIGLRLNKHTGLCRRCTALLHVEEQKSKYLSMLEERESCEKEAAMAEREYDRLRKAVSRLRKNSDHRPPAQRADPSLPNCPSSQL